MVWNHTKTQNSSYDSYVVHFLGSQSLNKLKTKNKTHGKNTLFKGQNSITKEKKKKKISSKGIQQDNFRLVKMCVVQKMPFFTSLTDQQF